MKPKKQIDFLVEDFFNTGKLDLNKDEEGITFDQLESLNEYGTRYISPFEDGEQQEHHEDILKKIKQGIDNLDKGNFDEGEVNLRDAQEEIDRLLPDSSRYFISNYHYDTTILDEIISQIPLRKEIYTTFEKIPEQLTSISQSNYYPYLEKLGELRQSIYKFDDDDIEKYFSTYIENIDNKIKELEGIINISDQGVTRTEPQEENKRLDDVENSNKSPLPTLSIDSQIDKESNDLTNLTTLQYLLLNNFPSSWQLEGHDVASELKVEIEEKVFGDFTELYVKQFQEDNNLKSDGVVDTQTWTALMNTLRNTQIEEIKGFDDIPTDQALELLKYKEGEELNIKEKFFVNTATKLLTNLIARNIYSAFAYERNDTNLKKSLDDLATKFKKKDKKIEKLEKLENKEKKIIASIVAKLKIYPTKEDDIDTKINDFLTFNSKTQQYAELEKTIKNKTQRDNIRKEKAELEGVRKEIKEYYDNKDIITRWVGGADRSGALADWITKKTTHDQYTIKGLFGNLFDNFKGGIENKDYSIDDVTNLIFRMNDTIYKLFEVGEDGEENITPYTKGKMRKALRYLISQIMEAEDREELISNLEDLTNKKAIMHYVYERSFCECENENGKYFRCEDENGKSSLGDTSRIIKRANVTLIGLLKTEESTEKIAKQLYGKITGGTETTIDKFDIISHQNIVLEGDVKIPHGTKIEIKNTNKKESILSEFFGLYKSKSNIKQYKSYLDSYNEVIEKLVELLNTGDGGIKEGIKRELGGLFLEDYMFYPQGKFDIKWSTQGRGTLKGEKRVTLRYVINQDAAGHKWVQGNCNLEEQPTESTLVDDYISEALGF